MHLAHCKIRAVATMAKVHTLENRCISCAGVHVYTGVCMCTCYICTCALLCCAVVNYEVTNKNRILNSPKRAQM